MTFPRFPRLSFTAGLCFLCSTFLANAAHATISYEVSMPHPEKHVFYIRMWIPEVSGEVTVQMAAWNALYQVRDFSSHVRQVTAFAGPGAHDAPVEKLDKQTWRVSGKGTVTITYATYWDEPGPFGTQLNSEHVFINPAMILMYVPDRRSDAVSLGFSEIPFDWQVGSSALQGIFQASRARAFSLYAANFDQLADAPIEAGKFEEFDLPGLVPAVRVIVHGEKWNKKEIEQELRRICTYELKLMEGAPYEHYTFIVHLGEAARGAGGGMEHANSTAVSLRSEQELPNLAAHEFFHLWNVKRIRPANLEPVDYTKEQYTRALWFAEGVTNTYAAYTLVRTQLWSKDQFYLDLSQQISDLEGRPANRWQSAEESSLGAWLEKYPLYNRPQESVSYYSKGQVLGVLLDIVIRDRSNNEKSLDDVMRAMNVEFAKQNKGYRDSLDIRLTAEKVAGGSFEDFFRRYIAHAEALPYSQILSLAGLDLRTTLHKRPMLGFYTERGVTGEVVAQGIDPESSAAQGGLRSGDVLLSWNGSEPPRNPERWVNSQKPGSEIHMRVRRDDREMSIDFRIGEMTETFYQVAEDSHAGAKAKRIREGILRGTTQPITARR